MALESTTLLVAMIRDTDGVQVDYGGETSWGHFEAEGETVLANDQRAAVVATDRSVVVVTGIFSTELGNGEPITVDGSNYTIREYLPFDDGKLTRIWLQDA